MSRQALPSGILALALAAGCGSPPPPDVLVYLVDTLRRDHLELYGYERETAPRLAALARDAVVYDDARSPTSWTRPAVASLLSGVTPLRHGAVSRRDAVGPETRLLAEYLAPLGYRSAAFVTNANVAGPWGFDRGFEIFEDLEADGETARADRVNEAVFAQLRSGPPRPFFWYVHPQDPHAPYDPPPPFAAPRPRSGRRALGPARIAAATDAQLADMIAAYDGEIRFTDHHFGALVDALREAGLYRDALIVFTSDHGEEFREHGGGSHGKSLYDEVLRVPLVIKYPGNARAGTRVASRVSLVDLLPTILAALGAEVPAGLDGVDLARLPAGGAAPGPARASTLHLDLRAPGGARHAIEGILAGRHKLLRARAPRAELMLFDLDDDPGERRNRAEEEAEVAARLAARLDAASAAGASPRRRVEIDPALTERLRRLGYAE